jgi:hypothetical protein
MIRLQEIVGLPNLQYHLDNKLTLSECVYRYSSDSFIQLFAEARQALRDGKITLNEQDILLIETTDIGEYGMYEGQKVPLDLPMMDEGHYDSIEDEIANNEFGMDYDQLGPNEKEWVRDEIENLNEQGEDTFWSDNENTITLQDILDLTKNIPITQYPTEKLAKIVLNWDDNPEEIERISQVEISEQYPILIMVDEKGKLQWILDGNHRAQKALRSQAKTIPAKLIKPSNLSPIAKQVLLGIVDSKLSEAEYRGKNVPLNKPKRGGSKKFVVYVKDPKSKNIRKVSFGGTTGLNVKIDEPGARSSFAARHQCATKRDKTKPGYWACNIGRYWKSLGGSRNFSGYW